MVWEKILTDVQDIDHRNQKKIKLIIIMIEWEKQKFQHLINVDNKDGQIL